MEEAKLIQASQRQRRNRRHHTHLASSWDLESVGGAESVRQWGCFFRRGGGEKVLDALVTGVFDVTVFMVFHPECRRNLAQRPGYGFEMFQNLRTCTALTNQAE